MDICNLSKTGTRARQFLLASAILLPAASAWGETAAYLHNNTDSPWLLTPDGNHAVGARISLTPVDPQTLAPAGEPVTLPASIIEYFGCETKSAVVPAGGVLRFTSDQPALSTCWSYFNITNPAESGLPPAHRFTIKFQSARALTTWEMTLTDVSIPPPHMLPFTFHSAAPDHLEMGPKVAAEETKALPTEKKSATCQIL